MWGSLINITSKLLSLLIPETDCLDNGEHDMMIDPKVTNEKQIVPSNSKSEGFLDEAIFSTGLAACNAVNDNEQKYFDCDDDEGVEEEKQEREMDSQGKIKLDKESYNLKLEPSNFIFACYFYECQLSSVLYCTAPLCSPRRGRRAWSPVCVSVRSTIGLAQTQGFNRVNCSHFPLHRFDQSLPLGSDKSREKT